MAQRAEQYDADDGDPQGGADPLSGIDHAARGTGVLDRDAGEHQVGHQRRPSNLGATVLPEREDGQGRRVAAKAAMAQVGQPAVWPSTSG